MRVVVTGIGVVSAIGVGRPAFEHALFAGERGIGPVTLFSVADQRSRIAAEVKAPLPPVPALDVPLSRTDRMGIAAAREAIGDAGLSVEDAADLTLAVGGTVGGMLENEEFLAHLYGLRGGASVAPAVAVGATTSSDEVGEHEVRRWLLRHPLSSTADALARVLGNHGFRTTLCSACSSGANAVVVAGRAVAEGRTRRALALGTDALSRLTFTGFNALGVVDLEPCRPFDVRRRGLSLGEGAGALVLETLEDAQARGATIYAELLGWGVGSEAHHITNPLETGAGAATTMRAALAHAAALPEQVAYVNAHGTATQLNDAMESRALAAVLGGHLGRVAVSSVKGQIGHTLGAAGAIEAIATVLAVARGRVPPTGGLEQPDPACALDHVIGSARELDVPLALSSSYGFGGANTVLVLGRPGVTAGRAAVGASRSVVVTGAGAATFAGDGRQTATRVLAGGSSAVPADPDARLDARDRLEPARARRLDRLSRLAAAAVVESLDDAGLDAALRAETGVVLGTHLASLDDSAAFVHRVLSKGARLASPAEFPNLVLSSATGHATIYAGLRGPSFTVSALSVSGEVAALEGVALIARGEHPRVVVGGVGCRNAVVDGALDPLIRDWLGGGTWAGRAEAAGAILLEDRDSARRRNAKVLARVLGSGEASAAPADAVAADTIARAIAAATVELGPERAVELVVAPGLLAGLDEALGLAGVAGRRIVAPDATTGWIEELGAVALVVAARAVAEGAASALVVGACPGMAVAWLLGADR